MVSIALTKERLVKVHEIYTKAEGKPMWVANRVLQAAFVNTYRILTYDLIKIYI